MKNFIELDFWQKISLIVFTIFSFFIFLQNFLFSDSFAYLHLREIDDLAFQASLRQIHQDISAFHLDRLIKLNDYGYGWFFWIIQAVLTYPFYLLAIYFDWYMPLIIMPRDISLAFTLGSAFFIYKSLSFYSKDEFLKFLALIFLISFPAFGYFAMRFGTVAQVAFFSSLTFYLTIKNNNYQKSDLKNIALAAAACVGTKLNGALILPVIGMIMAHRLNWQLNRENLKKSFYFLLNLLFFAVLFSDPSLFLSFFKPQYFFSYITSIKDNSHLALQGDFFKTLREVIEIGYLNFYLALIVALVLLGNIFVKEDNRQDLFFAGMWMICSLILLVKIMSMGTLYIINYSMVIMYLAVFFVISLESYNKLGRIIAIMFIIINLGLNYKNNFGYYSDFKYFDLRKNSEVSDKIEASIAIKKLIADPKNDFDKKINVLMDFRAIFPYAHLERENLNVQYAFDNFQIAQKQIIGDFDYISLNKASPFFSSEADFSKFIAKIQDEQLLINQTESRKIVQHLMKTHKLGNAEYKILFDDKNIIFFEKK